VPGKNGVFEPVIYIEPGGSNDSPNYVNENPECVREKITEWVGKLQGLKFSLCA
jgi:GH25 family lysozyme M1 (1,4-beta-N-acetylmuramidase)